MKIDKSTRHALKRIVRKDETYEDLIKQRVKCDASGCEAAGSVELNVPAGKFGLVTLFLCTNCIAKFEDD